MSYVCKIIKTTYSYNMKTVYKSLFLQLDISENGELIEAKWLATTKEMVQSKFQEEILNFIEIHNNLKSPNLLIDEQELLFTINPELQKWVSQTVDQKRTIEIDKVAIILSADFIQQLAAEQMMKEPEMSQFNALFFEDKSDARDWLINNQLNNAFQII